MMRGDTEENREHDCKNESIKKKMSEGTNETSFPVMGRKYNKRTGSEGNILQKKRVTPILKTLPSKTPLWPNRK